MEEMKDAPWYYCLDNTNNTTTPVISFPLLTWFFAIQCRERKKFCINLGEINEKKFPQIFRLKIILFEKSVGDPFAFWRESCISLRIFTKFRSSSVRSIDRGHRDLSNRPTRFRMESGLYWRKSDCEGEIRGRWFLVMCREYRETFRNREVCFLVGV